MVPFLSWERVLGCVAVVVTIITLLIGLRTSQQEAGIDLNRSHLLVFEASRQMSDFDRLRFTANRVALGDETLRRGALDRAFAMTSSRISNFRGGDLRKIDDVDVQSYISKLLETHDQMIALMGRQDCDDPCRAEQLVALTKTGKRHLAKLQGRALAIDGKMRDALTKSYHLTIKKVFVISMLLIGMVLAFAVYMARKNRVLKQHAEVLAESQRHIAEVSEYRARFLAGMSHEFRTPLNAIKGFSQLMLMMNDKLTDVQTVDYLRAVEKSAIDLEKLTDTILDLAKIDAGELILREEVFDLAALARDVERQFRVGERASGARLTLDLPPILDVNGDPSAIKRCFQNLISNALKFSAEDTTVHVRLYHRSDGEIVFEVEDNGCGIPEDEIDSVWGLYARSSYTRVSELQGTGLGLPIVRALVNAHGGEASLRSESGVGTTVTITLPPSRCFGATVARAA